MRIAGKTGSRVAAALSSAGLALLVAIGGLVPPSAAEAAEPPPGMPEFGYQGEITVPEQMQFNPNDEYIFPSIFHAGEHLPEPLGQWYLYTAPHDAPGGVIMMYADSLEGPWTEYTGNGEQPLIGNVWAGHYDVSHVSTPEAVWNAESDELVLYFHGENSTTRWATSQDGVNFTYGGEALTAAMAGGDTNAVGYSRVFQHPDADSDYEWAMFFMATEGGGPGLSGRRTIRLAESVDGFSWTIAPGYVVEPGEAEGANVSSADLWEWQDQLYVIYHASSGKIHARTIDATLRVVGEDPFVLHESSGLGEDRGRVASPQVVTAGGETYLFYEGGDRLGATIRWAKDGADVIVPPPFGNFPEDPADPLFAQCAATGSDEFEGSALADGVWDRVVREDLARHEVSDGALTIPTYAGGVAAAPLLQQELPDGPWQATTRLTIDPQQKFQQGGLLLYATDTDYAKFDMARATPGLRIELDYHHDGTKRLNQRPPAVYQDEVWLRLTSDGVDIRASVSYDGRTFTRFGDDIPLADAGFTHIGPFAFRGSESTPEIEARFDWFRFSPDAETYAACTKPDTTELAARVAEARSLDLEEYTPESAAEVRDALARAEEVLASAQDQDEVDGALAGLETALAGLEPAEDQDPVPSPEPTDPPTGPEPTDPPTGPEPSDPPVHSDRSPVMSVSDTTVRPGDLVEVRVTGAPGREVEIGIASEFRTLTTAAVVDGTATATVVIPEDMTAGTHHLQARGADGQLLAEVAIDVLGVAGDLPQTGVSTISGPVAGAAALLLLGGAVLMVRRRLV